MNLTVVLCTFNRCQDLAKVLESLAASKLPESVEWEVLVVDNNSTDTTRRVAESFRERYPDHFRYLFEPRAGKSHALNSGIREARGDVLAFTDDDVVVEQTWLRDLTAHLHNGKWAGAAGRILPERSFSPPPWIPRNQKYALAPLAVFDPNLQAGPLAESPFGANMAFQKRVFGEYGGFRTDLGPGLGVGNPQKSEDSEFGHRLLAAGEKLRYEPSAVVYHSVPQGRVRKRYFLDWWFDKARADIRAFGIAPEIKWTVAGIPLCFLRRLAVWTLCWMVTVDPSLRFERKLKVWGRLGEIVESYRLSRGSRTIQLKNGSTEKVKS
jgi:glucosyl-dolichyl phosphate glucuronosyltransferase